MLDQLPFDLIALIFFVGGGLFFLGWYLLLVSASQCGSPECIKKHIALWGPLFHKPPKTANSDIFTLMYWLGAAGMLLGITIALVAPLTLLAIEVFGTQGFALLVAAVAFVTFFAAGLRLITIRKPTS